MNNKTATLFGKFIHEKTIWQKLYFWIYYYIFKIDMRVGDVYRNIKCFILRGKNGWSYKDTWSFDVYLSRVIQQGTSHLLRNHMGYPSNLTSKEWDNTLKKIVKAFKTAEKVSSGDKIPYSSKKIPFNGCLTKLEQKEMEEGMKLFVKHFFSLWD